MRSRIPKVLHPLAGRPMLDHVIDACREAGCERPVVVVGSRPDGIAAHVEAVGCEVVVQAQQRGSGHALAQVPEAMLADRDVLVLNADAPLIRPETIRRLLEQHRAGGAAATLLSVEDPGRRDGRIVRLPDGTLERIVEDADADEEARRIIEFNVGVYCFRGTELVPALRRLRPDNRPGELYLTAAVGLLSPVEVIRLSDPTEAIGVNDRLQLARAEHALRDRLLRRLMLAGVTVVDPASTFVDVGVTVGQDTVLEPFTLLRGETSIGGGCRIGPGVDLADCEVGHGCRIEHSWLRGCRIGAGSDCGPYAKLRPGTEIAAGVHVGSFTEIVRSQIGGGSAVPHFSYLGDAVVGERVNIAAGTITANYDGETRTKSRTEIGDDAFIGVDTMLRAPVRVGRGARTGAGSVVTKDVPDGAVVVGVPARIVRRRAVTGEEREKGSGQ